MTGHGSKNFQGEIQYQKLSSVQPTENPKTWSKFPFQPHALATSCHHRWKHTSSSLKERSRCLVQPRATACSDLSFYTDKPGTGSRLILSANVTKQFGSGILQLSFHGFCLCSDPGAKEALHCLRDVNPVALPVSEQAL